MASDKKDALDELFVDESTVIDSELLRDLLKSYVQMSPEGKIFPLADFSKIDNGGKVLVVLLAKKVLYIKLGQKEKTTPKEIQDITGLTKGSVNPTLRELNKKRLVYSESGEYWVPNHALHKIKELLKSKVKP
jgi:hypothetical protein